MEKLFEGNRVRVDSDRSPLRKIRRKSGKKIFIADDQNLTLIEVEQTIEIARGMSDLEDAERLYPLYLEELRTTSGIRYAASDIWDRIAVASRNRYLKRIGRDEYTIPEGVRREINIDISIVSYEIDDILRGEDSGRKFYSVHHQDERRTIVGVCPGADIARKWISVAFQVIERAKAEHPELF